MKPIDVTLNTCIAFEADKDPKFVVGDRRMLKYKNNYAKGYIHSELGKSFCYSKS